MSEGLARQASVSSTPIPGPAAPASRCDVLVIGGGTSVRAWRRRREAIRPVEAA